ncbi:hypothetical protein ZOSMA_72G00300 [Zostera marina]|uniref:Fungal lipase-like domain-containing protein n=1 Tax=Zostera marina TaxID=29655 RepID=A0A0K9NQI5_ZOSMR|nr:hypothetical protein ZOSMA_72G00300 [Zostera marina]
MACLVNAVYIISETKDATAWDRIWWAGHSLGAAVTTCSIIRMNQNDEEYKPQTFLFDPPFDDRIIRLYLSLFLFPILSFRSNFSFLCIISFLSTASIIRSVLNLFPRPESLREWIPNLFVNPNDLICSGFVGHFENRKQIIKFNHHADDNPWDYVKLLRSARLVKHHHTYYNPWDYDKLLRPALLEKHHHTFDNHWDYVKLLRSAHLERHHHADDNPWDYVKLLRSALLEKRHHTFYNHWDYDKLFYPALLEKHHHTFDNHLDCVKLLRLARLVKYHITNDNRHILIAHGILQWYQYRCQMEWKTYKNK